MQHRATCCRKKLTFAYVFMIAAGASSGFIKKERDMKKKTNNDCNHDLNQYFGRKRLEFRFAFERNNKLFSVVVYPNFPN